ncbi:membrane protein [soil metagenome]
MGVTSFALWLRWPLRALGRNPLIRRSDRLEALSLLAVVVVALVAIPFAGQVADMAYDASMRTVDEQTRTRHSVEAKVTEGSTGMPADFENSPYVRAEWREGTQQRSEMVVSPVTVGAGAPITLWLDEDGDVVAAPLTASDARVNAMGVSGTVWITAVAFGALAALLSRRALDRSRAHAWERELRLLRHNDDGWANRHI